MFQVGDEVVSDRFGDFGIIVSIDAEEDYPPIKAKFCTHFRYYYSDGRWFSSDTASDLIVRAGGSKRILEGEEEGE